MATENGTATPPEPARKEVSPKQPEPEKLEVLRVYQHSNFFYWWAIWAYGFVCALLTRFGGHRVGALADGKELFVYPDAWMGMSFVALLLLVAFFTNYRLKGPASFIMILIVAVASLVMYIFGLWEVVFRILPALLIYMNLAFYVSVSTALLLLWLLATFVLDGFTYWEFTPGQITRRHLLGEGAESYDAHGLHIDRVSDDILINKVLGLWFLGYGTADLKITTSGAVREKFTIENVWRATKRDEQIRELAVVRPNQAV